MNVIGHEQKRTLAGRMRPLALVVVGLSILALLGTWALGRTRPELFSGDAPVAAAVRTDAIMRRTEVAFADAQELWGRATANGSGEKFAPARIVFFTRATETPCAGGARVSGPFYCAETGTAAFDLAFLATLAGRLQRQEELGLALVAGRMSAEHLQRELGVLDAAALRLIGARRGRRAVVGEALALQADCLTGVWAAAAATRLGPVPPAFWGQLVWSWRNVVDDLASAGTRVPAEFDALARGTQDGRQDAFRRGYEGTGITSCPPPAEVVARG